MYSFQIVIPDTGPLIALAKLGCLDALLMFDKDANIVLTDDVEFEVARRRNDSADAMTIHRLIVDNRGRNDIQKNRARRGLQSAIRNQRTSSRCHRSCQGTRR